MQAHVVEEGAQRRQFVRADGFGWKSETRFCCTTVGRKICPSCFGFLFKVQIEERVEDEERRGYFFLGSRHSASALWTINSSDCDCEPEGHLIALKRTWYADVDRLPRKQGREDTTEGHAIPHLGKQPRKLNSIDWHAFEVDMRRLSLSLAPLVAFSPILS